MMNISIKEKASLIAIVSNAVLTVIKFAVFYFTGSIAILAEAYHSFSDIFTSILTYFSVRPGKGSDTGRKEFLVSLSIGLFLFIVSVNIFFTISKQTVYLIKYPLYSGIAFLFFSCLSYLIYRFEFLVSRTEQSSALYSDSLHSKTDMISSLVTGFTLILYHMGFNLDKAAAVFIGIMILTFSMDVILNAFLRRFRKEQEPEDFHLLELLFNTAWYGRLKPALNRGFNLLILGLLCLYASSCFVEVNVNEKGLLERLGRVIRRDLGPGLHVKYPWPFDRIVKVKSGKLERLDFGNVPIRKHYPVMWGIEHGDNSEDRAFISGDNNFFYPYVSVTYKVRDLYQFEFGLQEPSELMKNLFMKCLTESFVSEKFYDIATSRKKDLETALKDSAQRILDGLGSGLEVMHVVIRDVHPPASVSGSFEDVIAAMQDRIASINVALEYNIVSLPAAQSAALGRVVAAETESRRKIALAAGESERMAQRYLAYKTHPEVSRPLIFLDYLRSSLENCQKVIVDGEGVELWMNYEKMLKTSY